MSVWAPLALTGVTASLLALPVAPALYELRKRSDAGPLPTSRHDGRIVNFAEVFRSRVEPLRSQLDECCSANKLSFANVDGMRVLLVGRDDFEFDLDLMNGVTTVMCGRPALIPAGRVLDVDVCAHTTLVLQEGAALRAALCTGDITLKRNSAVLRWLHADGSVYMSQGSNAYGRLSANQSIHMERGCSFQRMHAPRIVAVGADQMYRDAPLSPAAADAPGHRSVSVRQTAEHQAEDINVFASSRQRKRVAGNFLLPAGEILDANVIATGEIRLGRGTCISGSTKSYGDAVLEEDASVQGTIICGGALDLGPRSFVAGPVIAEHVVRVSSGCRVGTLNAPTTVSSRTVQIAVGCSLHGSVWAREQGCVG